MRADATNIIINNQNLADANITGSEDFINRAQEMTFKTRVGGGVSDIDLTLAVNFRNAFKGNNAYSNIATFFNTIESSLNDWNVGFDDILWWVVKKNFSYIEITQYDSTGTYLGNSVLGSIYSSGSNFIKNLWSDANTSTGGALNAAPGALGVGGNNYAEAGLTTFWDSASDSVGVMANSKYLQLDSTLPVFDISQESYGVPIPFAASTENKISQDTRNLMYDMSLKNTALMRRNLLGVAYGNLQIRGNMAADATVPHSVNLINDLPTFVKLNQSLASFVGGLGAAIPNFKLFGFVKFLSNIGNQSGFNLRDNRPITSGDRDFVVITNEERAQNAATQIEEAAATAELQAAIQRAAQEIPKGGRLISQDVTWSDDAVLTPVVPFDENIPGEETGTESTEGGNSDYPLEEGGEVPVDQTGLPGVDEPLPPLEGETGAQDDQYQDPSGLPTGDGTPAFSSSSTSTSKGTVVLSPGSSNSSGGAALKLSVQNQIDQLTSAGYNVTVILPNQSKYPTQYQSTLAGIAAVQGKLSSAGSSTKVSTFSYSKYSDGTHPSNYREILTSKNGVNASDVRYVVGDSIAAGAATVIRPSSQITASNQSQSTLKTGETAAKVAAPPSTISSTYIPAVIKAGGGSTSTSNASRAVSTASQIITPSSTTGITFRDIYSPSQSTTVVSGNISIPFESTTSSNRQSTTSASVNRTGTSSSSQDIFDINNQPFYNDDVVSSDSSSVGSYGDSSSYVSGSTSSTISDDGTASADTTTDATGDSNEDVTTPLQDAFNNISDILGGTGQTRTNYSNQQKASFVSFTLDVGGVYQEVDYLLKRIVRTSIRACKSISQRLAAEPTGSYSEQLDNDYTTEDLNSKLATAFGLPADSPLLSVGSSLISGIFTGQNATTNLLNAGQQSIGNLTSSLQSGVFGNVTQQVDGGITLLNGAGQLLGAGNLLPSTGELINALNPTQFLSTLEIPSILPNLNLGSLGDLFGIASSIGQNGLPTSITGLIQLQEQIYTAVCNFEIPIIEDIVQWINDWEAFFDGFEWKDIEKKIIDIVTKYIDQILERFNIFNIIKDIIKNLDEQIDSFLRDLWKRFTDCSRYQKEDRSGREGTQSTSWLSQQPPK